MKKTPQLFKVVKDMKSCHGGDYVFKVGEWTPVIKDTSICSKGWHLTTSPYKWFVWGCRVFEAEAKNICGWSEDKCVCDSVRLVKEVSKPLWQSKVEDFVSDIKNVPFFVPDGKPDKSWKLFYGDNWDAARDAAWDAAWYAARDAAWDAAWDAARDAARGAARDAALGAARGAALDAAWYAARGAAWDAARGAALYSSLLICDDLKLSKKHRDYIEKRWNAWKKGYGVLYNVDGVLYVYAIKANKEEMREE